MAAEFAELFGDSDGEDADFEGFMAADLTGLDVLAKVPMSLFVPEFDQDRVIPFELDSGLSSGVREPEDDFRLAREPFSGQSKLNAELDDDNPIDFFNLVFPDYIIELIVTETNRSAQQTLETSELKQHSRMSQWRPVSTGELEVFFALTLLIGVTQKTDIDKYWSNVDCISTPYFGQKMSRDRYLAIQANLHLADNNNNENDPLFKVRPFISHVTRVFADLYSPDKDLSFDEATCPWKGRLRFRVYNPAKPTRFVIKLYQVCEASSGYWVGFEIYCGKSDVSQYCEALQLDPDYCETTKIVIGLLTNCGLLQKGHHVYMDNYYSSPELFHELEQWGTYCCGTVRANRRGLPEAVTRKKPKMKQGEIVYRYNGNLLYLRYHDKRDVRMLTNIHDAEVNVLQKKDWKTNEHLLKPTCIYEYCKSMGGVDLSDQISTYYSVLRKTIKWYKKLFSISLPCVW